MATDTPSIPNRPQYSPRSRQPRGSSAARGNPPTSDISPLSLLATVDKDQVLTSYSTKSAYSSPSKEASTVLTASSASAEDVSAAPAGADAQLEGTDSGGASKKPAWNKPSNGATAEVGAVMDADSWPALNLSARASPKSSSTHSLKGHSHGSATVSQGLAVGSLSSQNEVSATIATADSTPNHVGPARQKSMKGGGGSPSHFNGSLTQEPTTQGDVVEKPPNPRKSGRPVGDASKDSMHRDAGQRGSSHGGTEQQPQSGSFRSNSGPQTRGGGSYNHSHGGKRDPQRSFGSRENNLPQQRVGSRPLVHGPTQNVPFIPPVYMRPFAPMVYTEMPSHVYYAPVPHPDPLRPMTMVPNPSMYFPMPDPYLPSKIVNQIDYYFSDENLVRDTYLRQNMDAEGWVSIALIAGFQKVMQLTDNIQFILDAIQASDVVEVQGDKVRRKNGWSKWIMPPILYSSVQSPPAIHRSSQNMLAARLDNVTLDEKGAT